MLKKLMNDIPQYLNYFLFEILDDYTINIMESGIKSYLKELKISDYKLSSTILDKTNVKINLQIKNSNIDFILTR